MENTGKILFEDQRAHWYVAVGEAWIGPFSANDIYQKILNQEITWVHFAWKAGQPEWKRICDIKIFQALIPPVPSKSTQTHLKAEIKREEKTGAHERPSAEEHEKKWFLHYSDSQFGPFSIAEVKKFLRAGKIHGKVYAWSEGMSDWRRLEQMADLEEDVAESQRVRAEKKASRGEAPSPTPLKAVERRTSPRRPLTAKVLVAGKDQLSVAVCRDVSLGGMQVLTDRIPGKVGDRIRLNVTPAGVEAKSPDAFVAEGVIVRVLEDGRGFSFRFERLGEQAREAIEEYIR